MKVSICVLNSKYTHRAPAPFCLKAGIKQFCKTDVVTQITESTVNTDMGIPLSEIIEQKPKVVGFCCYIWNIEKTLLLAKEIAKKLPDSVIVLGGPEAGFSAENILKENKYINYVIAGEGEFPFAMLCDAVNEGKTADDIEGVCARKANGEVKLSPPYVHKCKVDSPYTVGYADNLNGRIAYIESTRGCPFSCAFCLSGRLGGITKFDLENTKRDMLIAANSGARVIKFVDRTFNAYNDRTVELLEFIIENYGKKIPEGVCFHFEIAGDLLNGTVLSLFEKMPKGAVQLEIGLQSFNEKTLKAINRKTDTQKVTNGIKQLVSYKNMHIHIDLIAGLPFEDMASFRDSFNKAFALKTNMLQLGFLKLLHGAPMRDKDYEYPCKFSKEPPYTVISTEYISQKELDMLSYTENALDKFQNSGKFTNTCKYIFDELGFNPFDTLSGLGVFTGKESMRLDDYYGKIYLYFSKLCDSELLREYLICDYLENVPSQILPRELFIKDKKIGAFKKQLKLKLGKGIMFNTAYLYNKKCFVYSVYSQNGKGIKATVKYSDGIFVEV